MTVSSTTTFSYNRDQIINFAMRKLGILELGTHPDPSSVKNFSESLNLILKNLITKGVKIWTITELTLPLVNNQTSYVIGPTGSKPSTPDLVVDKPMKLTQAWLRNTANTPDTDRVLEIVSQSDYNDLGSKFSTGQSNCVCLVVGREQSTLKVSLTPDSTSASDYEIHLITQRQLYDVNSSIQTLDVPAEWLYPLGWLLAQDMILDYGVDQARAQIITGMANKFLTEVEDYDKIGRAHV